ncbi:MAG: GNAT family N-acetyltransferase [Thermoanaerobaculia bacterium]
MEWRRDDYSISTDRDRLDRQVIHAFLRESYWARGIPREVVDRAIENALCFGLYEGDRQIGFARVISDFSTFAYLADVFVLDSHRGRGLGTWLVEVMRAHPDLQNLRRWMLATDDAHGLYRKFGFQPLEKPERIMEIVVADIYKGPGSKGQEGRS